MKALNFSSCLVLAAAISFRVVRLKNSLGNYNYDALNLKWFRILVT